MSPATKGSLAEYKRKRDFLRTPEPAGATPRRAKRQLAFVVQKHAATRLHFDFRIELDGVLKSWAVTRGPSDNPRDKRLAVQVEDHPLEYGGFEGTIPKGAYGGGTVMLWDVGHWEPVGDPHEGLAKGSLRMRIHGSRMQGEWSLVRMKKDGRSARENWLLIKHRDEFAKDEESLVLSFTTSVKTARDLDEITANARPKSARAKTTAKAKTSPTPRARRAPADRRATPGHGKRLPAFVDPQLATLVDDMPQDDGWLFETKFDGYRCLAAVAGERVKMYTRNGNDWTRRFDQLVAPLAQLTKGSALIDGEVCVLDDKGRTDFTRLKQGLAAEAPLVFFAFDLLSLDGVDLRKRPLLERKERLATLLGSLPDDGAIRSSSHDLENGQRVLDALCAKGFEGVIAKRADAPYRGGRSRAWLKVKCERRQEFVIGGWSPSTRRDSFASLLVGTWLGDTLQYRGRVGTGFDREEARALARKLSARARQTTPFADVPPNIARGARWVRPDLVAEVQFTEFTPDGYMRHPSYLGLRGDKPAREVVDEKPQPSTGPVLSAATGVEAAARRKVRLTSPERVVYPEQGVTKAMLVAYYDAIAERMLPYIVDRPLALLRCPQGRAKQCFFQKHDTGGFPAAMKTVEIADNQGTVDEYFYITDVGGLIAGTQMNVLEWHLWGARRDKVERPERLIFDLDPAEGIPFADVRTAAQDIGRALKGLGLVSFPLLSGGKGIHVIAPIARRATWESAKAFSRAFAQHVTALEPDRFIATASKARREGLIYIDYLRNERGASAIAPWSCRSRAGAPVAVPVSWDELERINRADQFSLDDAVAQASEGDPWPGYLTLVQALPRFDG
ncbi:MAG: DNA ligase D [Cytophagaceae bacterium]|nr:DNA ligase D [Gemmatimonadaceae bacterium]